MATATIKVNRTALITKLESVKAGLEKDLARLEQIKADHEAELKKWREGATKHIIEVSSPRYGNSLEIRVSDAYLAKFPEEKPFDPKNPNTRVPSWGIQQDIKNLKETLGILNLSEEQSVNQSMLKNLAQYLA
jgi:hypothetical protein